MRARTQYRNTWIRATICVCMLIVIGYVVVPSAAMPVPPVIDPTPPTETAKFVFVHASIGALWLNPGHGNLAAQLAANNYFVSDYHYGNHTDVLPEHDYCSWPTILSDPAILNEILNHDINEEGYERPLPDPGGQNDIVMIKPCGTQYPIYGNPDDPPSGLLGCPMVYVPSDDWWSGNTVGNIKQAMLDVLDYTALHPDKFFVFVTAPPNTQDYMTHAENARAVANWMMHDLLDDYDVGNVMVFDLYNVLTSNAEGDGDPCPANPSDSDVGLESGNHHRIWNSQVQHQIAYSQNYSAYCDNHPYKGGMLKATAELIPLLNAYYNAFLNGAPPISGPTADAGGPYTGNEGSPIALDASSSDDDGNGSLSYAWDLDDDGAYDDASSVSPSYTWNEPGSFTVRLVVTDTTGAASTDTAQVTVHDLAPTADAGGPYSGTQGAPISLDGSASADPGGGTLSYAWDLDDDGAYDDAFSDAPSHTWSTPGTHTVRLRVTDAQGLADTDTAQVTAEGRISKSVTPGTADTGETVSYTIRVLGTDGPVTVSDALPPGVRYVFGSGNPGPTIEGNTLRWTESIVAGEHAEFTFQAEVMATEPTRVENSASAVYSDGTFGATASLLANSEQTYLPLVLNAH